MKFCRTVGEMHNNFIFDMNFVTGVPQLLGWSFFTIALTISFWLGWGFFITATNGTGMGLLHEINIFYDF